MMRFLAGIVLILLGVVLGLYVGGYLLFIGGIVQIITAFQVIPIMAYPIAVGLLKVLLASTVGTLVFYFLLITGVALMR